jgi:carboxypeptidase family protein/TonB-dependent receptor-like protein
MRRLFGLVLPTALAVMVVFATVPALQAQTTGGNVYGTVADESGARLPGAVVTATGVSVGGSRSTTSGTQGEFRFLNLDPGTYRLSVALQNFGTVTRDVIVNTGTNIDLSFGLKVAGLAESVTVTDETPVVDTKKVGTSTTLTKEELTQVPQGRDPWAVLKTVPGVLVDRVSIAGNEAGQQSSFTAKGASPLDTMYSLDGVVITDNACGGCSPSYYDFDAFDEIKVDTGGNDLKVMTGGVGINFVTKRGTNTFHGSVRSFFSHDDIYQGSNLPAELENDPRLQLPDGSFSDKAEHIDQINDWGADFGGPVIMDKLWFWASYGRNDIRLVRFNQTKDKTVLPNWNAKLNWQASHSDQVSFFFFNGAKEKFGRSLGAAGTEPDSILVNQGNAYADSGCGLPCGMHGLFKLEDNHIFSPNFFVNVKYAFYNWGYGFTPRGGVDQDFGVDRANDVAYGSHLTYESKRPWHIASLDGNYFAQGMGGNHELKFGFGYRANPVTSITAYSGGSVLAYDNGGGEGFAQVYRDRVASFKGQNWHAYLGDTFTKGRLGLNVGVRWDRQTAANRDSSAPANDLFPELVPAATIDAASLQDIAWSDLSPRVALNYALDESRKTVLRASYSRYAGQLNALDVLANNQVGAYYPYLAYNWVDLNHDHFAQRNEVLVNEGVQYSSVIDPNNPASTTPINQIDPNYVANKDNEWIVGIERELRPNLAFSAAYTYRTSSDIPSWFPRLGLTRADYTINPPVTVTNAEGTFTAQTYSPNPDKVAATGGGRILTNRPDYSRKFNGIELSLIKRLSNKWMMRAAFSWNDWTEHFDGDAGIQNPTPSEPRTTIQITNGGPLVEGGQFVIRSYGAKGDAFYNSKWQFSTSALYQLPAGFEVGASLFGREGYPVVSIIRTSAGADGGSYRALATPNVDDIRLEDVWNLDLRLAKTLKLGGSLALAINADLFNVLNSGVVLQRTRQVNSGAYFQINEIINPRVARIGVRLLF